MTRDKAQVKYLAGNKRMRFFATITNIKKLYIYIYIYILIYRTKFS
jgi:hypothetical protein